MKRKMAALLAALGVVLSGLVVVGAPQAQAAWLDCPRAYDGSDSLCVYTDIRGGGSVDYWYNGNPRALNATFKSRISSIDNWSRTAAYCLYDREGHTGNRLIVDAWKQYADLTTVNRTWWGASWNDAVQSIKRNC